jgi:alpha-tubulin suppressor-like RCC1 family protein
VDSDGIAYLWGSNYKYKLGHVEINRSDKDSQAI